MFAWPKMKETIRAYVQTCQTCQQAKSERVRLPIPDQAWSMITMDFVEGLPQSNRFNAILVVVDKFTKYGHFLPLAHPFTTLQVAQLYMDHIYRLHGLPQVIISDRDKIFTSAVWQNLFKLSDTQLHMSSSYHPQTDGQTERLNQCLEAYLRCTVQACPRHWSKWLPLAEYWYNTTYHTALGKTPFEVLYGHAPWHFGISNSDACHPSELEEWLAERQLLNQVIQQQLVRASQRMKLQAD